MFARLIIALLGCVWLTACNGDGEQTRDWPDPSPALNEVISPGGEKGWLFGTVHALPDGVEWRTVILDQTLAQSGVLVVEIADLARGAPRGMFADLSETPGQKPLMMRVEPSERADLQKLLDRSGMDENDFSRTESWGAALMLANAIKAGDPANGVDLALIADAPGEVIGLETWREQFGLFDTLSPAAQDDLLAAVALEAENVSPDHLVEHWLTGNLHRLDEATDYGILGYPELKQKLLINRNARWTEEVAKLVESGDEPFVAVGAAHIVSIYGLVALLEERGYTIRRLQ